MRENIGEGGERIEVEGGRRERVEVGGERREV